MNELLRINDDAEFPVDGRNLHERLNVETEYRHWFPRMCEYGFAEGVDFRSKMTESTGGRPAANHALTLSMAKEICMLQRTEQGQAVRRYLIEVEGQWNKPESVMARALRMADETIERLQRHTLALEADRDLLAVQNRIMAPKAEYFDALVERGVNVSIRETAKELAVKEKGFVDFLIRRKYLYRDRKGKLMPYAQYVDDLFALKECVNETSGWGGTQTLVTPKGRETFRLFLCGLGNLA